MKIRETPKETKHSYKDYEIIGTHYESSGGWVLGGRYYKEGGTKRNYNIRKDGKLVVHPSTIFEKLSHAKEFIDDVLIPKNKN